MKSTSPVFAAALAAAGAVTGTAVADDYSREFEGAYAGMSLTTGFNAPVVPDWEGSAFIGYNWVFGNQVVVGSELDLTHNPDSLWAATSATTSTLDGRLGFIAAEDIMIYGRAGGGYTNGGPGSYVWDVGVGAEYIMPNGLTMRGEFDRVKPFDNAMDTQVNGRLGVVMNF